MLSSQIAVVLIVPPDMRSMESYKSASVPARQMQNRDLTEPYQGLGICTRGIEIKAVGDSVSAFAARGGKDGANSRITQGVIDVGKAIFVPTRQVVSLPVERVRAHLDSEAPRSENLGAPLDVFSIWRACWRHELYPIARFQPRRLQRGESSCSEAFHGMIVPEWILSRHVLSRAVMASDTPGPVSENLGTYRG